MPLPVFWLIMLLALAFRALYKRKASLALFLSGFAWLFLISSGLVADFLVHNLERKHPPLLEVPVFEEDEPVCVMVLGGGHVSDPRLPANNQLVVTALGRLVEGIRIHKSIPGSKLILSGGTGNDTVSQASVLAGAAKILDITLEELILFEEPQNTRAEAVAFRDGLDGSCRLILVTSAVHMHRSMLEFQRADADPIAAPTNHQFKIRPKSNLLRQLPSAENLRKSESAIHEYVGIFWMKLGGR